MKKVNRVITWLILYCFFIAQLPLLAQDRAVIVPAPQPAPDTPSRLAESAKADSTQGAERRAFASRVISPDDEAVIELGGVRLEVPAGALRTCTLIRISMLPAAERLDEGMTNVTAGPDGYRFEPHGIQFLKPVRVTMAFDSRIAGSQTALSNLYTYFYNQAAGRWERLERESVNPAAGTVTSLTSHFTDMINATLKLPEGPQPVQYDLNSIKNLEAANPGEGIPLPDGPQPGPFGSASFRLPLRLPPGRGGVSPRLALRYSSDCGESWLGRGFDIEIPAITIDTRFGLPRYDGSDLYSMEGEELLPVGTDRDGSLLFQPRTEKGFARIRWYRAGGAGGGDDYWQVTEKNGAMREFGRTQAQAWLGPDRSDRSRTFVWYLSKVRDSFGNTIIYAYSNDQGVSAPGAIPNNYTYLSDIYYTGFERTGDRGAFHVQFVLEGADREDRRLDSRGTFPSKLTRRLERINLLYREAMFRSYQFSYKYNEFGQSLLANCSEADGAGLSPFYSYSFDYYALPPRLDQTGNLVGYDAFGAEEQLPIQGSPHEFPGLTSSATTSIGGDLYLGLEISFELPFIGKWVAARFGVRGGLQFSSGGSMSTLLDANGDGLPDMAWNDGGTLYACLNTGSGFDTSNVFALPGLTGVMEAERQNSFSFGASASLLGQSGSVTLQESWSQGKSAFMDVNGDGLVDYVTSDNSRFGLNNGSALASVPWLGAPAVPGGATGSLGEETYNRTYYVQDPFRAWKACRSGTVVIDQSASLLNPTARSGISLLIDPPAGQSAPSPLRLIIPNTSLEARGLQYAMKAGDWIYFHADAGSPASADEEASQRASWNIKIRYASIKLFEGLKDGAMFRPPQSGSGYYPDGDARLQPIYTYVSTRDGVTFTLKNDWEGMDLGTLRDVYDALIDHGYFVPRRSPESLFRLVLARAAAQAPILFQPPIPVFDKKGNSHQISSITPDQAILEGFIYEPETATFIWQQNATIGGIVTSDSLFMRYVNDALSNDQKRSIVLCRKVDSAALTYVREFADGSVGYEETSSLQTLQDVIPSAGSQGNLLPGRGLLLETTYDPAGFPSERLWLRKNASGQLADLVRESARAETLGQTTVEPGAASSTMGPDSIAVTLNDHGVSRGFTFTGKSLVRQLPGSLYEGPVSAAILSDAVFSAQGVTMIPAESWAAMTSDSDSDNPAFKALAPCYVIGDGGSYRLGDRSSFSETTLLTALLALQKAAPQGDSLFSVLPSDPSGAYRLILLTQEQMNGLIAAATFSQQTRLSGCFIAVVDTGTNATWYYQDPGLGSGDVSLVVSAMERYRRDVDLFPYYTYDSAADAWNIKADVPGTPQSVNRVNQVMDATGIQCWTILQGSIRYTSAQSLSVVSQASLPVGAVEDDIVPVGDHVPGAQEDVSVVMVPGFDPATGRATATPHYIHNFNSLVDYSGQNLVNSPLDGNGTPLFHSVETLVGGVYGWYYGLWSGYYPWTHDLIGEPSTQEDGETKPPYSVSMIPNRKDGEQTQISICGREYPVPVAADAWIGNVSSYSDVTMNPDLSTSITKYSFAAFIRGDDFSISRNGGDAYYRLPRGSGSEGGNLPFIRSSHSSATDWNGNLSIGPVGASGSRNTSSSWQYSSIMDLNGDRFPDLVSFSDSSSACSTFAVVEGTGQGFGRSSTFLLPGGGHLAKYDTVSYGFGASLSSSSGGIFSETDPKGKTKSTSISKPEASIGVSGSYGSTVQSEGFFDMNGDGLPDHVSRNGDGNYSVALNRGNGTLDLPVDWGSGMSVQTFPALIDLRNTTQGISTSGTGSLGANGGTSIGGSGGGASFSVGVSAGFNGTTNQTFSTLADVNGDGLPDQVVKVKDEPYFRVRNNLGDHFSQEVRLYRPEWSFSGSDYGEKIREDLERLDQGLNGVSMPGGIPGLSSLPSAADNKLGAAFNPFSLDDDLEYSTGSCFSLSGNLSVGISFWLLTLTITPGINGSVATTSASLKFTDIDGDGLPDHVIKLPKENFLRVKRNLSGKVGLLKTVSLPQGGTCNFGYARIGNTTDMPQSRWVMSSLTRDDGMSTMTGAPTDRGVRTYTQTYAYSNGYYDRGERLFYGFAAVATTTASGAVATTHYLNRDYHTRGMSSGSELEGPDAQGRLALYQQSMVSVIKTLQTRVRKASGQLVDIFFPNVSAEKSRQYQPGSPSFVETSRTYSYDEYGNVTDLFDNGTTGDSGQQVHARITYNLNIPGADYQKQSPSSIRVEDSNGTLMRLRDGAYGASGELVRLDQYESTTVSRACSISYDQYGSLSSISDPRGHTLAWSYDDQVHSYVTLIRTFNSGLGGPEYDSSMEWDYVLGKKTAEVDQNLQRMSYIYDAFGRLAEVRSPYDSGSVPAVRYQYNTSGFPWTAVTYNKLIYDASDTRTIQTVIAMDGLGRALQTAKQGERRGSDASRSVGWNLSGAIAYDGNGRTVLEGQPQFSSGDDPGLGVMKNPTSKSYDAQDRVTQQVLPDGSIMKSYYLVNAVGTRSILRSVDPIGNAEERESDGRGNITKVARLDAAGSTLMSATYQYDGLSQILAAVDSQGNAVQTAYDLLGRRTSLQSPDTGILTLSYDESGNLKQKVTSVLRGKGQAIDYQYDGLNRMVGIIFPESEPVKYVYGAPGAANNAAGRLIERDDGSGTVTYQYGLLGETTRMSRTISRLTPLERPVNASFSYTSDYLGRMQQIGYPDGEVVSYSYDAGGQVQKVTGVHWGQSTEYVKDIGYDEYGQRTYVQYGNGTRTSYVYDPYRRWLSSINTQSQWGVPLQNMSYRFDLVGNILGCQNISATYSTSQSYTYDNLYQLVGAQGTSAYHPYGFEQYQSSYQQSFAFDQIGNMRQKTSSSSTNPTQSVGADLSYTLGYTYYPGNAHQAEVIGRLYYRYDANGNMIEEREGGHGAGVVLGGTVSRQGNLRMTDRGFGLVLSGEGESGSSMYARYYVWDEENRLTRTVEGALTVDYRYGADGQRAVKYSSRGESLYFDSMWQAQTDYPSMRQSKHIYVGQSRVATRLNIQGQLDVGYENVNTYYYHTDHLGSSQLVSDYQGNEYERVEYTPYGETWIDKESDTFKKIPFKFTGKELDSETGLYYYGARYLNPRTSRWVSADPAIGEYLPVAPVNDEARKHNANLPGMGGVFNVVNLAAYHYGGNNPAKLTDPTGRDDVNIVNETSRQRQETKLDEEFAEKLRGLIGVPYALGGTDYSGIDCSGTVIEALREMGYDVADITAAEMASGKVDWITMFPDANQERQGEKGVLSFFSWGGKKVEHVNVGVGRLENEPINQVIDATEGDWIVSRNF